MLNLAKEYDGRWATFPLCSFEAPWQKLTTLLYSPGFDRWLGPLDLLRCEHSTHARAAGGTVGKYGVPSSETSAYPPAFNHYLALAVASLHAEANAPVAPVDNSRTKTAGLVPLAPLAPTPLPPTAMAPVAAPAPIVGGGPLDALSPDAPRHATPPTPAAA